MGDGDIPSARSNFSRTSALSYHSQISHRSRASPGVSPSRCLTAPRRSRGSLLTPNTNVEDPANFKVDASMSIDAPSYWLPPGTDESGYFISATENSLSRVNYLILWSVICSEIDICFVNPRLFPGLYKAAESYFNSLNPLEKRKVAKRLDAAMRWIEKYPVRRDARMLLLDTGDEVSVHPSAPAMGESDLNEEIKRLLKTEEPRPLSLEETKLVGARLRELNRAAVACGDYEESARLEALARKVVGYGELCEVERLQAEKAGTLKQRLREMSVNSSSLDEEFDRLRREARRTAGKKMREIRDHYIKICDELMSKGPDPPKMPARWLSLERSLTAAKRCHDLEAVAILQREMDDIARAVKAKAEREWRSSTKVKMEAERDSHDAAIQICHERLNSELRMVDLRQEEEQRRQGLARSAVEREVGDVLASQQAAERVREGDVKDGPAAFRQRALLNRQIYR